MPTPCHTLRSSPIPLLIPTFPLPSPSPAETPLHPPKQTRPLPWPSSPRHRNPSIRQQTDLISPPAFLPSPPLCFHHRRADRHVVHFGADAGGQVFLGLGSVLGLWWGLVGVGRGRGRGREGRGRGRARGWIPSVVMPNWSERRERVESVVCALRGLGLVVLLVDGVVSWVSQGGS